MKSTQSNRPNDKSAKMPSTRKTNQQPARSQKSAMSSCRRYNKIDIYILLFFSCWLGVYIHGQCPMRHPRTWSAVARSLTVIASSDWISAVYHSLQGHRWWFTTSSLMVLLTSTKNRCFQKMKSQSPWSANAYREAHIWLVLQVPQAWWNYLRRYTTRIQGCEPCNTPVSYTHLTLPTICSV